MPNIDYQDFVELARARGFVESAIAQDQAAWIGYEEAAEHISMSAYLDKRMNSHSHELKREPDDKAPELYSLAVQGKHAAEHGIGSLRALMEANGMQPGQIRQKEREEDKTLSPSTNPFHENFRGDRHAKIASLIKALGTKKVAAIATASGKDIGGSPLRSTATTRRWG